jgi:hypothetical protein
VDDMVDMHLINMALAGLGISAGLAVLLAATIIGFSAIVLPSRAPRSGKLSLAPAGQAGRGAISATSATSPAAPVRERQAA